MAKPLLWVFRGAPRLPTVRIFPFSVPLAPLSLPSDQYQAFRNHQNVRYWGRGGRRKREERKWENTDKKLDLRA